MIDVLRPKYVNNKLYYQLLIFLGVNNANISFNNIKRQVTKTLQLFIKTLSTFYNAIVGVMNEDRDLTDVVTEIKVFANETPPEKCVVFTKQKRWTHFERNKRKLFSFHSRVNEKVILQAIKLKYRSRYIASKEIYLFLFVYKIKDLHSILILD